MDSQRAQHNNNPEIVLLTLPAFVLVDLRNGCEPYRVRLRKVMWHLDQARQLGIARTGFPMVPDFGSTVHCVTGNTLDKALLHLGDLAETVTLEAALRGYIALNRVRSASGLLLVDAFSPMQAAIDDEILLWCDMMPFWLKA